MLGDAPVKAGQVVFTNTDPKAPKPNSVTVPFTEGSYAAGALTTGTYNVHVLPPAAGPAPAKTDEIPEKYRKAESSGLSTTVKAGTNTFDITLTK